MAARSKASIIITCYNYGRFLNESIDSALAQTHPDTETIVVDDGSTDNSREIIASYGNRVIPVFKNNGGMGSAFNAGFARSSGNVVCFLDADDTLMPQAIEKAAELFEADVAKVHWPLLIVDERGLRMGGVSPPEALPEGDLRECVINGGETGYLWPMTSGNAWSRKFLDKVFPMPECEYRDCGESYLATLAPAFGLVKSVREPLATYRMHQHSWSNQVLLTEIMKNTGRRYAALAKAFRILDIEVRTDDWQPAAESRKQVVTACEELAAVIPEGRKFIFIEWDQWGPGKILAGRQAIPFLEKDGVYWGKPEDDSAAIRELERLRRAGADFIVVGWPAFWWLDFYSRFHSHLRSHYRAVLENERLVVFELAAYL
jgi:hypothetical protein